MVCCNTCCFLMKMASAWRERQYIIFTVCFLKMKIGPSWAFILKLQVGNPWTKLAEIWPTDCQIVILKTIVRILISFFRFLSNSIFSTGNSNDLLSLTSSTQLSQKKKGTRQKSESRLSSQTCHEANAILIDFFRLFLADLDLNLQRHVYFCKKLVNSETR